MPPSALMAWRPWTHLPDTEAPIDKHACLPDAASRPHIWRPQLSDWQVLPMYA